MQFGESYFGEREHVLLAFSGLPRTLAFQPMSQRASVDNFLFPVKCSDNITVELTPLTNTIFVHAKARSRDKGISYTFSWRRGIPFKHLKKYNRKVYTNALKQRWALLRQVKYLFVKIHYVDIWPYLLFETFLSYLNTWWIWSDSQNVWAWHCRSTYFSHVLCVRW